MAIISTIDAKRSKKFYTQTLGLKLGSEDGGGFRIECGGTELYVYTRHEAPKAENTVAGFHVKDIVATVGNLRTNGVTFEEYDIPELKTVNGVATMPDNSKVAWFKDPDGNILALNQKGS